uniref:Putative WD repeat-containing protein 74 isoform X1 n=1 Tax=Davidia involucrata TaxID=16924 RepID=A0A5B6YIX2_DAVIN
MPRTSRVECPGCPPIRAITFDVLGLVKVIEARSKQGGVPKVVERWGEPDSSRCVLAASINDRKTDPLLVVARKSGLIEVLSSISGDLRVSISNAGYADLRPEDDAIVGLHLFQKQRLEASSRSCTLLTCTTKGHASMRSIEVPTSLVDSISNSSSTTWNICASGNILCSKVDGNENHALFGGKGVEVNVWDLDKCTKIWTAKSPAKNSLGIFTPTWFTSATFLSKDDHRKLVAGTNSHQVRLYDISAQRRPVISVDFRDTPIKAVTEDPDGHTIYLGNGSGDLASVDIRTGKLLGCFLGKCSGSIKSIARHPEHPVIASCGLDSYLRFWDIKSRQLLSAVFLKQHLTNVVFDSNFSDEEVAGSAADLTPNEAPNVNEIIVDEEELMLVKRKKASKEHNGSKKVKSKKKSKRLKGESIDVS